MDVLILLALIAFVCAAILAGIGRSWAVALVAAGLAFEALAKLDILK